ncbi:MAG: prepilin-type N-terminal cleavage/methylation domain-containing protein [Candidatus Omnitrophica bacterium]|nr:prepilin-type N-terminal cleavage/methylation domain-containing protein [Candidatus Omnitrophota bacterium]
MKRSNKGFTLVEIMIVVAIIILLAAIAIPNLLRARLNANEAAAIAALRTLSSSMESYRAAQTSPTYPTALTDLSTASPAYIDSTLGGGAKQGYSFVYTRVNANQYSVNAVPITAGVTGSRTFAVKEDGVITSGGTAIQ